MLCINPRPSNIPEICPEMRRLLRRLDLTALVTAFQVGPIAAPSSLPPLGFRRGILALTSPPTESGGVTCVPHQPVFASDAQGDERGSVHLFFIAFLK